ncbi:MAG: response regulator [Candidatus Hydrogenedentes bacterium]|nr:response regulator [Candidatus Hydrogenedentota bacterium]MBI3119470.1 response regulator [Candidatus Hydrogenedentota bacterium]
MARILIADDEPHIRRVVELKLQSAGHQIRAEGTAAAAFRAAQEFLPELMVTDYKMPGEMTGVDLIKAVRKTVGVSEIPVILLTGSVAVLQDLTEALANVPRVTILSKPFSPRILLKTVQEILKK